MQKLKDPFIPIYNEDLTVFKKVRKSRLKPALINDIDIDEVSDTFIKYNYHSGMYFKCTYRTPEYKKWLNEAMNNKNISKEEIKQHLRAKRLTFEFFINNLQLYKLSN